MASREVYLAADPVNAEIVKDMLINSGIQARVCQQRLWGGMGGVPANVYPSVWVNDEADYQPARELVEAFERGPVESARAWTCPQCGELLMGQFDRCWRCETQRPDNR